MDTIDLDAIIKDIPGLDLWANNMQLRTLQRLAMIEAINQALILAADRAIAKENPLDYGSGDVWVDKQSILDVNKLVK